MNKGPPSKHFNEGVAGLPALPELRGSIPGVLDKSQTSRVLRHDKSTLHFARFDPYIATSHGISHLSAFNFEEPSGSKRIVLEHIPGMGLFWRWVPHARTTVQGVKEGMFPRPVDVCGTMYKVDHDQWDIYKLDPLYDCIVHNDRHFIRHKDASKTDATFDKPTNGWPSAWREGSTDASTSVADSDRMDVDDDNTPSHLRSKRTHRKRKDALSPPPPPPNFNFEPPTTPTTPVAGPSKSKRFMSEAFSGIRKNEEVENEYFEEDSRNRNTKTYNPKLQKRVRTLSPTSAMRARRAKSESRTQRKQTRWHNYKEARRRERDESIMREVLSEVPQAHYYDNRDSSPNADPHQHDTRDEYFQDIAEEEEVEEAAAPSNEDAVDDEAARLEESRQKMAALNVDRDLQREREKSYRAEQDEARRSKAEALRQQEEARQKKQAEALRKQREAELLESQQRERLAEHRRRQQQEVRQRLEREQIERHRQWFNGHWSASRAIERFKVVSEFFQKAAFHPDSLPLTSIDIPWPTLSHPGETSARDVDYEAVSEFFRVAKMLIREQEYKGLMKMTFQRFHPDRWRSKRLFQAILDEHERNEVETAVETISKAIGAKYGESKESEE